MTVKLYLIQFFAFGAHSSSIFAPAALTYSKIFRLRRSSTELRSYIFSPARSLTELRSYIFSPAALIN